MADYSQFCLNLIYLFIEYPARITAQITRSNPIRDKGFIEYLSLKTAFPVIFLLRNKKPEIKLSVAKPAVTFLFLSQLSAMENLRL